MLNEKVYPECVKSYRGSSGPSSIHPHPGYSNRRKGSSQAVSRQGLDGISKFGGVFEFPVKEREKGSRDVRFSVFFGFRAVLQILPLLYSAASGLRMAMAWGSCRGILVFEGFWILQRRDSQLRTHTRNRTGLGTRTTPRGWSGRPARRSQARSWPCGKPGRA